MPSLFSYLLVQICETLLVQSLECTGRAPLDTGGRMPVLSRTLHSSPDAPNDEDRSLTCVIHRGLQFHPTKYAGTALLTEQHLLIHLPSLNNTSLGRPTAWCRPRGRKPKTTANPDRFIMNEMHHNSPWNLIGLAFSIMFRDGTIDLCDMKTGLQTL
jgi:hypothetical protein